MIYRLIVPGPIEDVEEVRVLEWHCKPGAAFVPGAMLVELETHKAVVEVRAGQPGVLRSVLCVAGAWQRLADTPDEALPDPLEDGAAALAVAFEIV